MMRIYDSIKQLIIPELLQKAAVTLRENEDKVVKGTHLILPSLMGGLLHQGATDEVKSAIALAGENRVANQLDDVFGGSGIFSDLNIGERFENALIGSKNTKFRDSIARHTGLSVGNADRLTNWVSLALAGYMGNEIARGNQTLPTLMARLKEEKNDYLKDLPSDLASLCGVSALMPHHAAAPAAAKGKGTKTAVRHDAPKKRGWGWLLWLILGLIVLALLLCWWRSCERRKLAAQPVVAAVTAAVPEEWKDLTLPDGVKLRVHPGSLEDKMVRFLNSDEYKNATEAQLKDRWFHLSSIKFQFGSSDALISPSEKHLDNFAAILKAWPAVKVRLASYADRVGDNKDNLKLSEARARFISGYMDKKGITDRFATQGFGEEYAKYPVDAPDSLRSHDRDIALRFVK